MFVIHHKNRLKEKPHDYLIRYRKDRWQNPSLLNDKIPGEIRDTGTYLNSKGNLQRSDSQHQIRWRENYRNPTKIRDETRLNTLTMSFQYSTWSSGYSNMTTEEDQRIHIEKEVKVPIYADDMIEYVSDLKNSLRECL